MAVTMFVLGLGLEPEHAAYAGVGAIVSATQIPRSARLQLRWQF